MQEDGGEQEEIDFPEELDEFLAYCIQEHGGDFQAISYDFLDIAQDLEEPLVQRASEFFSPEALRQRWLMLGGELPEEEEPSAGVPSAGREPESLLAGSQEEATAVAPAEELTRPPPTSEQGHGSSSREHFPLEGEGGVTPSDFNVFRDSLRNQIDKIYSDVQQRLPTTLQDDSEEDDDPCPVFSSGRLDASGEAPLPASSSVSASISIDGLPDAALTTTAATDGDAAAIMRREMSEFEALAAQVDLDQVAAEDDGYDLRQRTLELFGTDDLAEIFPELPAGSGLPGGSFPVGLPVGFDPAATGPSGGSFPVGLPAGFDLPGGPLDGPASKRDIAHGLPTFDAVLMCQGVNPNDIGGPLIEPPATVKAVFDSLRDGLQAGRNYMEDPGAALQSEPQTVASTASALQSAAKHAAPTALASQPKSADPRSAPSRPPHGTVQQPIVESEAVASANESEATDDSADEDFAQMRRKAKATSNEITSTKDVPAVERHGGEVTVLAKPKKFTPPARTAAQSKAAKPVAPQKFIKLELVESSDDDDDAECEAEKDNESTESESIPEDADGLDDTPIALSVMKRLLRRASSGECGWDTWLEATRKWPRLPLLIGSPAFFRRDTDLKVAFDIAKLRAGFEEYTQKYKEQLQKKVDDEENRESRLQEYVREAERRREVLGSRFGGGFLLTSRHRQLDDQQEDERSNQRAHKVAQEKASKELEEQEEEQRRQQEEKVQKKKAAQLEKEKAKEEQQKQLRQEAASRERERLVEVVATKVQKHKFPLYDKHTSYGPVLPVLSYHAKQVFSDGLQSKSSLAVYLLPWGTTGDQQQTVPSLEQIETLDLLCASSVPEALLLVRANTFADMGGPDVLGEHAAALVFLVNTSSGQSNAFDAVKAKKVLLGPLELNKFGPLFQRQFALWACDRNHSAESCSTASSAESVCIALNCLHSRPGVLATVLTETVQEGLAVVGMRLVFANRATAQSVTSVALKGVVSAGRTVLVLAVRGPNALSVWTALLGPADPQLARATDPMSLNARFGGQGRSEAIALPPPSSIAKAHIDVVWGFGGRVDPEKPELPSNPLFTVLLEPPKLYAARIDAPLSFADMGGMLGGMLLRAGDVRSLVTDGNEGCLTLTAMREGGGSFLKTCSCFLSQPLTNSLKDASKNTPVHADRAAPTLCALPPHCGLVPKSAKPDEESEPNDLVFKLGEPEVVVIGFRPHMTSPSSIREAFENLFAKFGPKANPPASLDVGKSVDLVSVRLLDFAAGAAAVESSRMPSSIQEAFAAGLDALRQFQCFLQVVRRAGSDVAEAWWAPSEALASGPGRPTTLLCLRGENMVSRFQSFLSKEWKLQAATAGDVFFSPNPTVAYQAYHAFFSNTSNFSKTSFSPFEPSVPCSDIRSLQRFVQANGEANQASSYLGSRWLFPQQLSPQLTVAVLLPPCDDRFTCRVLTTLEQNGFALCTAVVSGGLSVATARILFDQEVADGHLTDEDWSAFQASAGCSESDEDEEGSFKAIWLVLSRHQAIKRLAQLCGDGCPSTNQKFLYKSLRMPPLQPIQNGIRCATSWASAEKLLQALGSELAPRLAVPPCGAEARLGIQACARTPECGLVAVAVPSECEVRSLPALAILAEALAARSLQIIGLRAFSKKSGLGNWPPPGSLQLNTPELQVWSESCKEASQFLEMADKGCDVILVAVEGLPVTDKMTLVEHLRAAAAAVSVADSKGRIGIYVSPSAPEAAAGIVLFFDALFAGKHYVASA